MNLREYQLLARTTAIYPEQYKIAYPCLGLIGETGELVNANSNEDIIKEIGDCFWYCANLMSDLDLELIEIALTEPRNLLLLRLAEKVKKILRDGVTEEKKIEVQKLVGQLVFAYNCTINALKIDLEYMLQINIDKLQSRQQRGVLGGSGDNR